MFLPSASKASDYIERTCVHGRNHAIQFFTEEATGKVDFLKISLSPKYSRYLEINYTTETCRISCMKAGKTEYINIEKMIEPDFPDLVKLKERVGLYVVFS